MIVFPNAKINLGLNVLRRRDDGYHDISTVFVPYKGLSDVLEVVFAVVAPPQNVQPQINLRIRKYYHTIKEL